MAAPIVELGITPKDEQSSLLAFLDHRNGRLCRSPRRSTSVTSTLMSTATPPTPWTFYGRTATTMAWPRTWHWEMLGRVHDLRPREVAAGDEGDVCGSTEDSSRRSGVGREVHGDY